jgi:probable O-glycosylation ligase (exosortase A-associated)
LNVASRGLTDTRAQAWLGLLVTAVAGVTWAVRPDPFWPIFAATLLLAMVSAIRRPFIVCLVFILLSFFRIHEVYPFLRPLHLPFIIALITMGAVVWHVVIARTVSPYWSAELRSFLVFFAITSFGVFFAFNKPMASDYWVDVFSKIGLMTLAFAWLPRVANDFTLAAKAFAVSGVLVASVAIYNKVNGIDLVESTRVTIGRDINSLLGDPNDLALVLLFPLSFCLAFAIHRCGTWHRVFGTVAALLILCAIVFTQSRGGLIGVLAVFAVALLRTTRSKVKVVVLALIAAAILYQAMGISGRVSGGGGHEGLDDSAAHRVEAWQTAVRMAVSRPLTGVGLANFADSFSGFGTLPSGNVIAAHSTWFGVLGETGFAGLIAFVVMVGFTFRNSLRSYAVLRRIKHTPGSADELELIRAFSFALVSGIVGFCVAGSFLTQGFIWPVYILLGLSSALQRFVSAHVRI